MIWIDKNIDSQRFPEEGTVLLIHTNSYGFRHRIVTIWTPSFILKWGGGGGVLRVKIYKDHQECVINF